MIFDEDIKIAGEKPSKSINATQKEDFILENSENIQKAKKIGKKVAEKFLEDGDLSDDSTFNNEELLLQRKLLMSFAATVGFEKFFSDDTLSGIAQKSFLDTVKKSSPEDYRSSSDTGAFSFYYLAYRRGDDIERRMGQTFAMLCSHDGDPIFQELGEALYCWFLSVVKDTVSDIMP